jgi:hypothetical protein
MLRASSAANGHSIPLAISRDTILDSDETSWDFQKSLKQ